MTLTRRHSMPFGAQALPKGGVRFRLWAPAARRIELVLYDADTPRHIEMHALADGWFERLVPEAREGTRYRYRIDGGIEVPDPASRLNPEDVHGPSAVVDPERYRWRDAGWRGRPWHESVIYEIHVGAFSPEGTFEGVERRLDHLVTLGVTTLELMPVADFPGRRGWGYDGVLPFAPDAAYGSPEALKSLVDAAHRRGLAVMLDVVYNHFGPEGNYLHAYAPQFFTERHHTPWGAAINFDGEHSRTVREFFVHNALYWLEEFNFDGLRFDAVHAICDDSTPHILTELARRLRAGPGAQRPRYLVLENAANQAHLLGAPGGAETFDAQWNDDFHHCVHVVLTGEHDGYYADYAHDVHGLLARCLTEGFAYQGEESAHEGRARGEPSAHLPPTAFVVFLQNHDQIGNRAYGERLAHLVKNEDALFAATALLLLQPSPPLLFMGEEWAASQPFPYFCDFGPELARSVREGRRREFARFVRFRDDAVWATVPDPVVPETLDRARLRWEEIPQPPHARWLERHRELLAVRRREIVPRIPRITGAGSTSLSEHGAFTVGWRLSDGSALRLLANLTPHACRAPGVAGARVIFSTRPADRVSGTLEPWSVTWLLESDVAERTLHTARRTHEASRESTR